MRLTLGAWAAVLGFGGLACSGRSGAGADTRPDGGRLVVERVSKRTVTLSSGPARAIYCPADSVLLIMGIGQQWANGFAIRVVLPVVSERDFTVTPSLSGLGTATAAFRPLGAGAALLGTGGTVRLEPSKLMAGRFDVAVPDSAGTRVSVQGHWSSVPLYALPKGSCASP